MISLSVHDLYLNSAGCFLMTCSRGYVSNYKSYLQRLGINKVTFWITVCVCQTNIKVYGVLVIWDLFFYVRLCIEQICFDTFPKLNMEPENRPSQKETHLPASFSRVYVNLPGSTQKWYENGCLLVGNPCILSSPIFRDLFLVHVFWSCPEFSYWNLLFVECWSRFCLKFRLAHQTLRFKPARMQSFGDMPWVCWMICTSRLGVPGVDQGSDRSRDLRSDFCVKLNVDVIFICIFIAMFVSEMRAKSDGVFFVVEMFFFMKLFWAFMIQFETIWMLMWWYISIYFYWLFMCLQQLNSFRSNLTLRWFLKCIYICYPNKNIHIYIHTFMYVNIHMYISGFAIRSGHWIYNKTFLLCQDGIKELWRFIWGVPKMVVPNNHGLS